MIKILYVHGYEGHGNGHASQLVREALDKRGIEYQLDAPEFPVTEPEKMYEMLKGLTRKYKYVVASSMGAFYAMMRVEAINILVNPALPKNLRAIRDADPENNKVLTDELLESLQKDLDDFFEWTFDDEELWASYFVFGTHDDIAGNEEYFRKHYHLKDRYFYADMGHIMEPSGAEKVVDIIEQLEANPKTIC